MINLSLDVFDSIKKILNYSFCDIDWTYSKLSTQEKSLITEKEFLDLKKIITSPLTVTKFYTETFHDEETTKRIYTSGDMIGQTRYYRKKKLHRVDGPAWIFDNGPEIYFLKGKELTKREWKKYPEVKTALLKKKINKIVEA